ncbi:8958_t:CDS:2 [Entrophospora sp. SA101]|nr:9941_t:CDS:2 [Entrophospora sp. SA101]CAJ0646293.1 8958_t:CDS:2 [Entrophospora sp. SA101]CAJ0823830.1 19252_t:CDS:2 [Entrophospora sp. SA101]CAJ0908065.1 3673_t:CDS:2 [Entrophospora sp. SA101]
MKISSTGTPGFKKQPSLESYNGLKKSGISELFCFILDKVLSNDVVVVVVDVEDPSDDCD